MFLQMALHFYFCQIYPLTHTFLLKMMVYPLDLKLVLWFVHEPLVDYVGEMANMVDITQLGFYLKIRSLPLVLMWYV